MYRNANSHFAEVPRVEKPRSKFRRPSGVKFSGNVGDLIPFYVDEILPGDTVQLKTSLIARMQTLVAPIMDNLFLDTFYFYVPSRILWTHFKEFNGENTASKWYPTQEYTIPQLKAPATTGFAVGTIADYMGIPTGIPDIEVSALPFRAYAMICNEYFRDQNNTDYLDIPFGDSTVVGVNTGNYVTDVAKGGLPFKAAKYHDYFTSCLPSPLKASSDVKIPIGSIAVSGSSSVVGTGYGISLTSNAPTDPYTYGGVSAFDSNGVFVAGGAANKTVGGSIENTLPFSNKIVGVPTMDQITDAELDPRQTTGLEAVFDQSQVTINAGTLNDLRLSFALQHVLEADARGGTRYREMLLSHFGVHSPDARQNVPEYLGGSHIPININQVVQTSATQSQTGLTSTPQGNVAGFSVTSDVSGEFIKSFSEHGFIIGICCMRYDHTYQQGLERFWSRKKRFDFYMPEFAQLGEQKVLNKEIYCQGTTDDDEVFGYQEAWAEYRYKPSRVAGEMRSTYSAPLDVWHLGDNYTSLPILQSDWIFEDKANVDRCLQVSSSVSNQFWADFYVMNDSTRVMPMYSIPGLKTL